MPADLKLGRMCYKVQSMIFWTTLLCHMLATWSLKIETALSSNTLKTLVHIYIKLQSITSQKTIILICTIMRHLNLTVLSYSCPCILRQLQTACRGTSVLQETDGRDLASLLLWFSVTKNFGPLFVVVLIWLYSFVPLHRMLLIYFYSILSRSRNVSSSLENHLTQPVQFIIH